MGALVCMAVARQRWVPSLSQARDAAYLDFEGNVHEPPSLLGVLAEGRVRQWIVEPGLVPMAGLSNSHGLAPESASLTEALRIVAEEADRRGAEIAAYTRHDIEIIEDHCLDAELVAWYQDRYRNAKKTLDYWYSQGQAPGSEGGVRPHALQEWMDLAGITRPGGQQPGHVGGALRTVRQQLRRRGGDPALLTPVAKGKWTRLLAHNETDLTGLQALITIAAQDLARR